LPAYALLAFSSIAGLILHNTIRFSLLRQKTESLRSSHFSQGLRVKDPNIQEAFRISEPDFSPPPLAGTHFREIAYALRKLAHQCRPAVARRELLQLATSFDRRAEYFDN
jgi:hypothetical protein